MERLTAGVLHEAFGNVIMPGARIRVPFGWAAIAWEMMQSIHDLPTDIRAYIIVSGIGANEDGLLVVDMLAVDEYLTDDGRKTLRDIVHRAVDRAAWTCERDGAPGWYTSYGPTPRILCAECQYRKEPMHVA